MPTGYSVTRWKNEQMTKKKEKKKYSFNLPSESKRSIKRLRRPITSRKDPWFLPKLKTWLIFVLN